MKKKSWRPDILEVSKDKHKILYIKISYQDLLKKKKKAMSKFASTTTFKRKTIKTHPQRIPMTKRKIPADIPKLQEA